MSTDITVRGQARDTRDPDQAILSISVHAEARDWAEAHIAVTSAMSTLNASLDAVKAAHPEAIQWTSVGQAWQNSYQNNRVQLFTEDVRITICFVDFPVMSEWVFANTNESVRIQNISWELSAAVRDQVRNELGDAAIKDARQRADTFATAAGLKVIGVAGLADPGLLTGRPAKPGDDAIDYGRANLMRAPMMAMASAANDPSIDLTPQPIESMSAVEAHFIAE